MAAGDNIFNNAISTITPGAGPTWTPTGSQSAFAREEDSPSIWYWTGATWVNMDLDFVRVYTDGVLADNATSLGDQLQALGTAIDAIVQDGNHTYVSRANGIEDTPPSGAEVPSPLSGDTADVFLQTAEILEKWVFTGSWVKVISIDLSATISNLGYTPSPTNGIVTNTAGTDSTILAADGTNAGLILPSEKAQISTNTGDITDLTTLSGVASNATSNGTFTGIIIPDSSSTKVALQSLETAIGSIPSAAVATVSDTNSIQLTIAGFDLTADVILDATQDNYVTITESATGLRVTTTTLTAYDTYALAVAEVGIGGKYVLTKANLEGVPSDGLTGPIFTRLS